MTQTKIIKVVVTGASGFLGGYVLQLLSKLQNIEVVAVTRQNINGWHTVSDYSESPRGDVLIHLAEDNDRMHVAKLGKIYEQEVQDTIAALSKKDYSRVVYASSAVLYGDVGDYARSPNDPIQCNDTYSSAKRQSELTVLERQCGVIVRLSNVYGIGMSKNNVVSTILRQIPGEGWLEVMDTNPVRDFIWVADAAEGIVALALSNFVGGNKSSIFNLGTGVGVSIGSLAVLALKIAKQPERVVHANNVSNRKSSLILDFADTTVACGWRPRTSLHQGLIHMLQIKPRESKDE